MKKLSEMVQGSHGIIKNIEGNQRFLSRITSIGLTPGSAVEVLKNSKKQPMLLYGRDTVIAVDREACEKVYLEDKPE